ncbi:hypothetical protein Ade02nite_71470 [Paractinoplanes deccanensis]|uniref:CoA-binding domain-containing protein n=1 Tax=Paractinoplanes deccanensis TaxID=113561 RepID=A0ABQ3YEU3_9ACTN|nr:hypothetical protein Ade02nite_71470 [Actinoplanes deccanensis]
MPLLAPRAIAIVGAMQHHGDAGYEMVRALCEYGYRGRVHPVLESGVPVSGVPGHRALCDLPGPVDLLVIAGPSGQAAEVLRDAGKSGIPYAMVLGAAGARRGRELARVAREHGVHLLGPGCFGLLNTDPRVRLNATLSRTHPTPGGLALAAQSSAAGVALLEHVARDGCGVASFVPLGDAPDCGLIDFWCDDPHTRAVALYLNSPADHAAFARAAFRLSARKPVLTIAGGHPRTVPLCTPAGIVRATGLDELADAARMLVDQPLPSGNRIAVVGNAGGLAEIAAGAAEAYGFALPDPAGAHPMSLGPDATPPEIAEAVEAVACGGGADIVLAMIVGTRTNVPAAMMTALADVLDDHPRLTAAVVLTGGPDDVHRAGARAVPVYREHDRAIRALAHAHRYTTWRRALPRD